ncbi:unnamed protein product [Lymnaea stagnalis]|uniref:HAT C-terminal dimerisation domain-containing protein n=1 Tax=Lymnaea stagnalis TaxID=6523 RepID=A0AAV2HBS6_LYMST
MAEPQIKKSRLSDHGSGRSFQEVWTEKYGVVESNGKALCLLCHVTVVSRTWNVKRHFETNHRWLLEKNEEERKEYIFHQLQEKKHEPNIFLKFLKVPTNLTSASFCIAHSIAQHGKALNEGEFIKETLLKCAPLLFQDMINKDAIIQRISDLPVSRNTIKDNMMTMIFDVQQQLIGDLNQCQFFSICLDETADITSSARLAVITRFYNGQTMREELVKLEKMPISTSGYEICNVVIKIFNDLGIDISKVVSVLTNGAPNMAGNNGGFVKLFMESIGHPVVPFHCNIHQEVLCANLGVNELQDVLTTVTKIVNLIASRPFQKQEFVVLLQEVELTYSGRLMHNNLRWLSRGKVLEIFVHCYEEIKSFIENKNIEQFPQLSDVEWASNLMFFTDLSVHMNELNLKLQGFGKSIDITLGYVKAFETKLQIFKRDVETKTYKYFPRLKKYFDEVNSGGQNEMEPLLVKYLHILNSIIDQFGERFNKFRSLEQTFKIIKYPDVVVYTAMDLDDFQWLPIEELELQLAEFQSSNWTTVFVDLRSQLEDLERNCQLNEESYSEQEILNAWSRIPDSFSALKVLAMALLTIFHSTYSCETLFSALNNIRVDNRSRNLLTEDLSDACMGLRCTKYIPSISELTIKSQE